MGKLGIEVAKSTVDKYRIRSSKPPSPTWRAFLKNHVADLVSIDFFTIPTINFNVLFVLVVLLHHRRKVIHVNVTENPTAQWAAQQIVEAFPWESAPKYLVRDRDAIYGETFRRRVASLGIDQVLIAPRRPWQNPYVERLIGGLSNLSHQVGRGTVANVLNRNWFTCAGARKRTRWSTFLEEAKLIRRYLPTAIVRMLNRWQ